MNKKDKISIIVPIYNMEQYLKKCIDSIINQTYQNIEILLINDGSTDGSRTIIDNYVKRDNRIKAFHIDNGGVSRARNIGIENSTGEWIAFVDADDFLSLDMYEVLYKNALRHNVFISVCAQSFTKDTDRDFITKNYGICSEELDYETSLYYLLGGNCEYHCNVCNKLFKKEVIGDVRFKECISNGEDILFNFEIFLRKPIKTAFEHKVKYFILFRDGSACHDNHFKERHLSEIKVWRFIYDTLVIKPSFRSVSNMAKYQFSMVICNILLRLSYDYTEKNRKIFYEIRNGYKRNICFVRNCNYKYYIKLVLISMPYSITSIFWRLIKNIV